MLYVLVLLKIWTDPTERRSAANLEERGARVRPRLDAHVAQRRSGQL